MASRSTSSNVSVQDFTISSFQCRQKSFTQIDLTRAKPSKHKTIVLPYIYTMSAQRQIFCVHWDVCGKNGTRGC